MGPWSRQRPSNISARGRCAAVTASLVAILIAFWVSYRSPPAPMNCRISLANAIEATGDGA